MKFPSFQEIVHKAKKAFDRFPLTMVWALLGTFFIVWLIEVDENDVYNKFETLTITLVLGVSWLIGSQFFIEQLKKPKKWLWLKLLVLALLLLFYLHLPKTLPYNVDPKYYVRFALYMIAGHLFVFFAPFVFRWNSKAFWNYLKNVIIAIVRSGIYSGILFIGLFLALLAFKYLFDLDISERRIGQLFVLCAGIVNTWVYLSDFPKDIHQETQVDFKKPVEILVRYILVPLVILYFLILYAYSAKIVFTWELPKGWVSYLVLALSFLGLLVQVILNPIQKEHTSWGIRKFHPWFYILLLPLLVLLFVAIFTRIFEYGVTENRYFILLAALWVLGVSIYMLFYRDRNLSKLPISLFVLALISSFGVWSAFNISKISQTNRFIALYQKAQNNSNILSFKDHESMRSVIRYLYDRNSLEKTEDVTGLKLDSLIKNESSYSIGKMVLDSLKIISDPNDTQVRSNDYDAYSFHRMVNQNIAGYDRIIQFDQYYDYIENDTTNQPNLKVVFNRDDITLTISSKVPLDSLVIPLEQKFKKLMKYGQNLNKAPVEEISFQGESKSLKAKLVMEDFYFYFLGDSINMSNLKGVALVKIKDEQP
jgi:hypothetical protein